MAELITCTHCRNCGALLTLEEMHYYDCGDGTATCDKCEGEWSRQIYLWRIGELEDFPDRP